MEFGLGIAAGVDSGRDSQAATSWFTSARREFEDVAGWHPLRACSGRYSGARRDPASGHSINLPTS